MKFGKLMLSVFLISGIAAVSAVQAQPPADSQQNPIADIQKSPNQLTINTKKNAKNVTMTVTGPDGYYSQEFIGDAGVSINIESNGDLADGEYRYEFTASSDKPLTADVKANLNNGRSQAQKRSKNMRYESVSQSGQIRVKNGQIITDDSDEPAL